MANEPKVDIGGNDARALIFLHIGRTGGSTLHSILDRQYPAATTYTVGYPVSESIESLRNFPDIDRRALRLIRGHMPFGIHSMLPQGATYITMLRDPVERALSIYQHVLERPKNEIYKRVMSENITFERFVENPITVEIDNGQTRALSGDWESSPGECADEQLAIAIAHLDDHFSSVGLVERFDESILLFRRRLGWKWPFYRTLNASTSRPSRQTLREETLHWINHWTRLDRALYQHAATRFEEVIRAAGASFEHDLAYFRLLNSARKPFAPLLEFPQVLRKVRRRISGR